MPAVTFEDETYEGKALTGDEQAILQSQLTKFFALPGSFYEYLLKTNYQAILGAAQVAKELIGGPFTGISCSDNELGFQKIRSGHFRRTTAATEAADNDWTFTFTAGNDYWVGYGANNTTAMNMDKDGLVLILGLMFTQGSSPIVEELYPAIGRVTYPPIVIRDAWAADNDFNVRGIPIRPLLIVPKGTALWQTRQTVAGTQELVATGLTFGKGRWLRAQSYSAISL